MKTSLCLALSCLLTNALSAADFGQIKGGNTTLAPADGIINLTSDIPATNHAGAIAYGGFDATGTTTLTGNITINAGESYLNNLTEKNLLHGLFIGTPKNAAILLQTSTPADSININTHGLGACGIFNQSANGRITLDATASTAQQININSLNQGSSTAAYGIYSSGTTTVRGNLNIFIASYNEKNSSAGLFTNLSGLIDISGKTKISSNPYDPDKKSDITGIRSSGGIVILRNTADINVSGNALHVSTNSTLRLSGALNLSSSNPDKNAIYVENGGTLTDFIPDAYQSAAYQYNITGNIAMNSIGKNTLIDLHMTGNSTLAGTTTLGSNTPEFSTLNLNLSGNSTWLITGASTLSHLTLSENASLTFNLLPAGISTITADTINFADGSRIYLNFDPFEDGTPTTFRLFDGNSTDPLDNLVILSADKKTRYEFTPNADGSIDITGTLPVPEPAAYGITLTLLAMLTLAHRLRPKSP